MGSCGRIAGRSCGQRSRFSFPLFSLLSPTINEHTAERAHCEDNSCKAFDAPSLCKQINPATNNHEGKNKSEPLTASLGIAIAFDHDSFKLPSVGRLSFGHRHDALCTTCKRSIVIFEKVRMRQRSGALLNSRDSEFGGCAPLFLPRPFSTLPAWLFFPD